MYGKRNEKGRRRSTCSLIQQLSTVHFTEVLGFCLTKNHFHLRVRMLPEAEFSDAEIRIGAFGDSYAR